MRLFLFERVHIQKIFFFMVLFIFNSIIIEIGFPKQTLFPPTPIMKTFMTRPFLFNILTKDFFKTEIVFYLNKNVRLINK